MKRTSTTQLNNNTKKYGQSRDRSPAIDSSPARDRSLHNELNIKTPEKEHILDDINPYRFIKKHLLGKNRFTVKSSKFKIDNSEYEINIEKFNTDLNDPQYISELREDINEISPLLNGRLCDGDEGIYTWILGSFRNPRTNVLSEHLWSKEVLSRHEIGTTHISIIDSISPTILDKVLDFIRTEEAEGMGLKTTGIDDVVVDDDVGDKDFKMYFSGEYKINKDRTIKFNFSSGTFMLEKFMFDKTNPDNLKTALDYCKIIEDKFAQHMGIRKTRISSPTTFSEMSNGYISQSVTNVPKNFKQILDNLKVPYTEVINTKASRGSKKDSKKGGGSLDRPIPLKVQLFLNMLGLNNEPKVNKSNNKVRKISHTKMKKSLSGLSSVLSDNNKYHTKKTYHTKKLYHNKTIKNSKKIGHSKNSKNSGHSKIRHSVIGNNLIPNFTL